MWKFCCAVDDFQPSSVDSVYSQSVLRKPHPIKASASRHIKASASSLGLVLPESNLAKVPSMTSDDSSALSSSAAFRPFRSQPPAAACEVVPQVMSQVVLPPQSGPSQSAYCPSMTKPSTMGVGHSLPAAAAMVSHGDTEQKSTIASLSSSNGISAMSTPLVASLMLHPSASSFQLVSAIPAAHLTAGGPSRAAAPSLQYIVPPVALSNAGGKIMQMVSTGGQASSQSATPQLTGFQLAALPRTAIQLSSGPQVFMLCPQSQAQQQQHQLQNSPLSSVLPVMVATGSSQQLGVSK